LHNLLKKAHEYGGTIVAVGTTAVSIYTGLKHVI
jgi:S-adenosylmethionine:tRNA-ribosyltransferase-isomerase (queuine synthetase)